MAKKKNLALPEKGLFGPIKSKVDRHNVFHSDDVAVGSGSEMQKKCNEMIGSILQGQLAGEIKVSLDGTMKIRAQDAYGATMTLTSYVNKQNGYQEGGFTALPTKMTPSERKVEAKRLKDQDFSQSDIADRLGVSQKTISNDLK